MRNTFTIQQHTPLTSHKPQTTCAMTSDLESLGAFARI